MAASASGAGKAVACRFACDIRAVTVLLELEWRLREPKHVRVDVLAVLQECLPCLQLRLG